MTVSLESFSAAIDKLYAAAADRERWSDALFAIEELTGSSGAIINLVAKSPAVESTMLVGQRMLTSYDQDAVAQYNAELVGICPRVATGIAKPDLPYLCDYMILDETAMDRDPVYEWYTRQGARYFIGSTLGESDRFRLMCSLQRSTSQGHVQAPDVELFTLLKPHLHNAVQLADRLGTLTSYRQFTSAILEALPQALFALGPGGTLLFANRKAQQLLSTEDGLRYRGGAIEPSRAENAAAFNRLVGCTAIAAARLWMRIARPSGRPDFVASAWPLSRPDAESVAASATTLLLVHDPTDRAAVSAQMLTEIYGLTASEARIASALSQDHSIESTAHLLQIEVATARTHLKAVFRKMGVSRQQDLIGLLASMPLIDPTGG